MSFLDAEGPRERLATEMHLVAANLIHLTSRYEVLPVGMASLVIPRPDLKGVTEETEKDFTLVLSANKHAKIPYKAQLGAHQLMRTRLRTPGLTPATIDLMDECEVDAPWAWQSGISSASTEMVTWVLMRRLKGKTVSYNERHWELLDGDFVKPDTDFMNGKLGTHCYPTEQHFVRDVCAHLSPWWKSETEVDGELDGEEVRIDAILTSRADGRRVGVEFKHPHTIGGTPLRGLKQASKYRRAAWERHGRLPIAYCCPGKVPIGREADFVKRRLGVGLLDIETTWTLAMPDYTWREDEQ